MTREEAIEILEEVKTIDDSMYQYNEKYLQALDLAIKALEQTDALDKMMAELETSTDKWWCGMDGDCFTMKLSVVFDIIDKYRKEQE